MSLNPPRPIPEPDYDDPKETYAFFGLAAYNVQCFEQSVILLIAALKANNTSQVKEASFDEIFELLDKMTLGKLKERLSKINGINNNVVDIIKKLLPRRNYLMHHFWVAHSENSMTEMGRRKMLEELQEIIHQFHDADRVLVDTYMPLWKQLGLREGEVRDYISAYQKQGTR